MHNKSEEQREDLIRKHCERTREHQNNSVGVKVSTEGALRYIGDSHRPNAPCCYDSESLMSVILSPYFIHQRIIVTSYGNHCPSNSLLVITSPNQGFPGPICARHSTKILRACAFTFGHTVKNMAEAALRGGWNPASALPSTMRMQLPIRDMEGKSDLCRSPICRDMGLRG